MQITDIPKHHLADPSSIRITFLYKQYASHMRF